MKRINTANRASDLFGAGKDGFKAAQAGVSSATFLSALFMNHLQEAVVRTIEAANFALSDTDYDQFPAAIQKLISDGDTALLQAVNNALGLKAPLESPIFTGTPKAPTADLAAVGKEIVNVEFLRLLLGTGIEYPGMRAEFYRSTAPNGWLKANGAAVLVSAYANLTSAIYCGDANNATAVWGYRCTSSSTPSTTRSTTGTYIVLPDARGEYSRGWDDGRGIDSGRTLWSSQAGQNLAHTHAASASTDGYHQHTYISGNQGVGYQTGGASPVRENASASWSDGNGSHSHTITVNSSGGSENLVRNLAALVCIKY